MGIRSVEGQPVVLVFRRYFDYCGCGTPGPRSGRLLGAVRDVDPLLAGAQGPQDHPADVLRRMRDQPGRETARRVELGVGDRRQQQRDLDIVVCQFHAADLAQPVHRGLGGRDGYGPGGKTSSLSIDTLAISITRT
jgi:hypothetical protein